MSREEQIIEAGKIAAEGKEFSVLVNRQHRTMSAYEIGFIEGAEWADSHPQWIPVEEELPPPHYEGANSTDFVLVFDCYDVMFGYYDFGQKNWHGEDYKEMMFDITHWMPIEPPQGNEDKT